MLILIEKSLYEVFPSRYSRIIFCKVVICMKINQMRFFVEVCNCGSITKASEVLHVTQPAVSQAILEMEREYGVKLFRRTSTGLELTREGSFILLDIREILDKIDILNQKMTSMGKSKHMIRLGMSPMIAIASMDYVNEYKEQHPNIVFDYFHESSPLLRRKIADGALDICLATGDNSKLYHCETQKLTSFEVCVCVSPQHALASRKTVSWDELVQQKLVVYKDHYQIGQAIQPYLTKHLTPDTELYETNNTSVHFNLITRYNYCGFMYKGMADNQPGVVSLSLDEPIFVDVDLICQINSKQNRDVARFASYIQHVYENK